MNKPRVVIDTNILFEGLTKKGGAPGLLVEAWLAGLLDVCVSDALAYEYVDVLARKLSPTRWQRLEPVMEALLARSRFVAIYYSWRPASPDPRDEHVIDCAMNSAAVVITANRRDFVAAEESLSLRVLSAPEAVMWLVEEGVC